MKVKIPEEGGIVQSKRGRDCGKYYVIVEVRGQYAYLADGKTRTQAQPKKKNLKHLYLMPRNVFREGIARDGAFDNNVAHLLKGFGAGES